MIVEQQTVTAYKAGGRRWLTKDAAYNAAARNKINERCDCYPGDSAQPPEVCEYHLDMDRYVEIRRRLAAFYKRADKRIVQPTGEESK